MTILTAKDALKLSTAIQNQEEVKRKEVVSRERVLYAELTKVCKKSAKSDAERYFENVLTDLIRKKAADGKSEIWVKFNSTTPACIADRELESDTRRKFEEFYWTVFVDKVEKLLKRTGYKTDQRSKSHGYGLGLSHIDLWISWR